MYEETNTEFDELESMADGNAQHSEFVGDRMNEESGDDIIRLYIQNLNGLKWDKDGGRWPYICEVMETIDADISCFSELNVDTNNYHIRTTMEKICHRQFKQNYLTMSSSKYKTTTAYKPGGTAILARNNITSKIKSHTRDRMGRWTSVSLTTASSRKIRIISAYQVCNNPRPGTNTAASQQAAQITEETCNTDEQHRRHPRQAFIHDLKSFIQQIQAANEDIILAGDFNEEITSHNSGMDRLATDCGLVDLFSIKTGTPTSPSTYQRGTKRLDYILMSPILVSRVHAAGYDPFGYRIPSDHRGMYVDFKTEALLEQSMSQLESNSKRDFYATSPGVVEKYVTAKMAYLNDHEFFERLKQLEEATLPNHDLAEKLDKDFVRAALHGARVCIKKQKPPWSPKLAQAWADIHFYRLANAALTTAANYQPALLLLQSQWLHLPRTIPNDTEEIRTQHTQAVKRLKEIRMEAQQLRDEFLVKQASIYIETGDTKKASIIQRIVRAESQKKVYQKINYLRNNGEGTLGLSTLKIPRHVLITATEEIKQLPDTPEHWETITVPEDIERILIQRNQHHFAQANGTPFTTPQLNADIGYKADGVAADLILNGQFNTATMPNATSLLIRHLQSRITGSINSEISSKQILQKLQNWNEATTTSPSGLHLGHYHCTWRNPTIPRGDPQYETIKTQQKLLLRTTTALLNYAIRFGYTYNRWHKVVNVMLQKEPDNPRIHRLRVIHLYEADYNLLLAVKWRQGMHNAEKRQILNDALYGSRPGRSAHDPAFVEVLQNETYRMSMKPGINFDLDAASCYDRIIPNIAAISSRRAGMPHQVIQVNMAMLEKSRYHVRTSLGVSTGHYSHTATTPIYGTGQGSGNSPMIWCFLCSALFDALESETHGSTFCSYDKQCKVSIHMIGFVDDCTQRVNQFDCDASPPSTELIRLMTKDVQLWNDLLWASGGMLEQQKCSFHLIQSEWTSDGHPFLKGGLEGQNIYIRHNGHPIPTRQKTNYTAHKTLGCYINPAYTHKQAWQNAKTKNQQFAIMLETNYFTRYEAWTYYTAFYLPSITYQLPITPLTKAQCDQLDARFLRTLVPRCGYNRNMARQVRYAPTHMGGAGFRQLYTEQGILMLQNIHKFLNSPNTTVGKMLLITISWTQSFLGTSQLFLTDVQANIPPAGPSYLLDLRLFLRHIQGSIHIANPPVSPLLRENDRHIMDIVLQQKRWKDKHVIQINSCRRYLQAQTLADITNIQGTRIKAQFINGDIQINSNHVQTSVFNQRRPGPAAWKTWKRFLSLICDRLAVLRQPLLRWIVDISQVRHWPAFIYDPVNDDLYSHHCGTHYRQHLRLFPGIFSVRSTNENITPHGYPTATTTVMDTLRPTKNFMVIQRPPQPTVTINKVNIPMDQWEHQLLEQCRESHLTNSFIPALQRSQIIICSDGSATNDRGSFGFIIATRTGQRIARGRGPAAGAYPNSFRSEAHGVLAALRWIHHASKDVPLQPNTKVHHYLDNQSVITRIEKMRHHTIYFPNTWLQSENDVITEILRTLHQLPITIEFHWVKGHQDDTRDYSTLDIPAQLNCDADYEASQYAWPHDLPTNTATQLPGTPSQLIIQNKSVTSHIKRRTREAATSPAHLLYLQKTFRWDHSTVEHIDWTTYSHILRKYTNQWSTIVKHLHDVSPTGHIAHRNNKHLPHECPACSSPYEDNLHLMTCSHISRLLWQNETTQKLSQYSISASDPYLLDILRDALIRFHRQLNPISIDQYPPQYHHLILQQTNIGWDQVYRGRWAKSWTDLQTEYQRTQPGSTLDVSASTWLLGLGRLMIDQWLKLWHLRNDQRHKIDEGNHNRLRAQALWSELTDLYQLKDKVCPTDSWIFHETADLHIATHASIDTIENWIATHKAAIHASVQQAERLGITRNRTLDDYPAFNPIHRTSQQASLSAGLPAG